MSEAELTRRDLLLSRWKASGKNINAFCVAENITEQLPTLYNWERRYQHKQRKHEQKNEPVIKGKFIPITLRSIEQPKQTPLRSIEPTKNISCEIHFPSGVRIIFHTLPDSDFIKELI